MEKRTKTIPRQTSKNGIHRRKMENNKHKPQNTKTNKHKNHNTTIKQHPLTKKTDKTK